MDELKLKLSTRLMRGIAAKFIARSIRKKYGYKVNVQLNELDINVWMEMQQSRQVLK